MAEIDVTDEAIFSADPATLFSAIQDEVLGKSHWWLPYAEFQPRGNIPANQVGGIFEVIVHTPRGPSRWIDKTVQVTENMIRVASIGGAFVGEGIWTTEPAGDKTWLRYRWHVRTNRWLLGLLAHFVNIPEAHHKVMQAGFKGLGEYLRQAKPARVAVPA